MELRRSAWRSKAAERAAAEEDEIRKLGAEEMEKHVRKAMTFVRLSFLIFFPRLSFLVFSSFVVSFLSPVSPFRPSVLIFVFLFPCLHFLSAFSFSFCGVQTKAVGEAVSSTCSACPQAAISVRVKCARASSWAQVLAVTRTVRCQSSLSRVSVS
jgi:hypothetical protein